LVHDWFSAKELNDKYRS